MSGNEEKIFIQKIFKQFLVGCRKQFGEILMEFSNKYK